MSAPFISRVRARRNHPLARRAVGVLLTAALTLPWTAVSARAQTLVGHVTDESDQRPIALALIRLVDEEGVARSAALADSTGRYRVAAPAPGTYYVEAEGLGYENIRSPLIEVGQPEGVYPFDMVLRREPIELAGFTINAERLDRRIHLIAGLHPSSLRWKPIPYETIEAHRARAHSAADIVRWEALAGIYVRERPQGVCIEFRGGCLPVYLDTIRIPSDMVAHLPIEFVVSIVVLPPGDSMQYPGGAVLLLTKAFIGA